MTSRHFVERGVERRHTETCQKCGLREMCKGGRFVCINELSDHYGHVLSEHHPACAAIRYRREVPCTDLRNTPKSAGGRE